MLADNENLWSYLLSVAYWLGIPRYRGCKNSYISE